MLGVIIGIISGLVPGLHPNLFGKYLGFYSAISALIMYKYFSHIREIFLMIPDESNVLALHPMYKLYKAGAGFKALLLSNFGLLIASIIAFVTAPILISITKSMYTISREFGVIFLISSIILLLATERKKKESIFIILLSGALGLFALKVHNGIVPLLSGFFAIPLLINKTGKTQVKQRVSWRFKLSKKALVLGFAASLFLVITPAIGPTQSAIFTRNLLSDEEFLFAMGVVNGFDIIFAVIMFSIFGYSRSGVINESFSVQNTNVLPAIAFGVSISIIGFILSNEIGAVISKFNFNIDKIKFASLLIIITISYMLAGISGVIILITAGTIGLLSNRLKVRMVNCMGSLMVPYLFEKLI